MTLVLEALSLPAQLGGNCGRRSRQAGRSQLDLFAQPARQAEVHEALPLLCGADAVVGQLLHGDPVDALRVPDPVVHLEGGANTENVN